MMRYPLYLLLAIFVSATSCSGWSGIADSHSLTGVSLTSVDKAGDEAAEFEDKLCKSLSPYFPSAILGQSAATFYYSTMAVSPGLSGCHAIRAPPILSV
jgi:hypothetical protein